MLSRSGTGPAPGGSESSEEPDPRGVQQAGGPGHEAGRPEQWRQLPLPGRVRAVNRLQLERRPITSWLCQLRAREPKGQRELEQRQRRERGKMGKEHAAAVPRRPGRL